MYCLKINRVKINGAKITDTKKTSTKTSARKWLVPKYHEARMNGYLNELYQNDLARK